MTVQQNPASGLNHEVLTNATKYKGYYYCKVLEGKGWLVLNSAGETIYSTTYQHEAKDYITELVNLEKEQQEAHSQETHQVHHQADSQESSQEAFEGISKELEELDNSTEKTIEERTDEANDYFDCLDEEQLWELVESCEQVKEIQIINRYHKPERAYIYQVQAYKYDVFNGLYFWQSEVEKLGDNEPRPFFCTPEEAETNAQSWSLKYNMEAEEKKEKETTEKSTEKSTEETQNPISKPVFANSTEELEFANQEAYAFTPENWAELIGQAQISQEINHAVGNITVYQLDTSIFPNFTHLETAYFWNTDVCPVSSQESPLFSSLESCVLAILGTNLGTNLQVNLGTNLGANLKPEKAQEKPLSEGKSSSESSPKNSLKNSLKNTPKDDTEARLRLQVLPKLQGLQEKFEQAGSKLNRYDKVFNSGDDIRITVEAINSGVKIHTNHPDAINEVKTVLFKRGYAYKNKIVSEINELSF